LISPAGIIDAGYNINMQKVESIVPNRLVASPSNVLGQHVPPFEGGLETAAP
jgi:hypothetical protein